MRLIERAPINVAQNNEEIVSYVKVYIEKNNALNHNLWKNFFPVLDVVVTQKPTLMIIIDLISPKDNVNILSLSYQLYHQNGIIYRIKLVNKIEPLKSTFMRLTNDKYYYKMFKNNDLISMIDTSIRSKDFMKSFSNTLRSHLNTENTIRYYNNVIIPLMQDEERVIVMNRDSKAIYDITRDYYRDHSSKYILIKKSNLFAKIQSLFFLLQQIILKKI